MTCQNFGHEKCCFADVPVDQFLNSQTNVYEFKNWSTGNTAMPEVEFIGYFAHSFSQAGGNH